MWLWKHIISILSYTDKVFSNHSLLYMLRFCGIISAQSGSEWFPSECSLFFFLNERTSGIPTCPTSATVLVTRAEQWSWVCFRCNACHPSLEHRKGGKSTVYLSGGTFLMFYGRTSREDLIAAVGGDFWPTSHTRRITELRPCLCGVPTPWKGTWWYNRMNLNQHMAKIRT